MEKGGEQKTTVIGLAAAILIGVSVYFYNHVISPEKPSKLLDDPAKVFEEKQDAFMLVHICGVVKNAGVYRMRPNDRVVDAIKLAGGAGLKADLSSINLAESVKDGLKINIPEKVHMAQPPGRGIAVKAFQVQVNINRASLDELDSLPGIGSSTAKKIVEARPFSKPEDLLKIPRFSKSKLDKLRQMISL